MRQGFTYIELLIALAVIAVLFVPIMQLFSHALYSTASSQNLITAANLARWQMERTKNLNLTKKQWREKGNTFYPDLSEPPFEMNGLKWRIKREMSEGSGPLRVDIGVYNDGALEEPVVSLVTLIEDTIWEESMPE
jgi:prepilin-type N-terminal cleavage/methylation domain-containing protein